jgi:hypothetical protein
MHLLGTAPHRPQKRRHAAAWLGSMLMSLELATSAAGAATPVALELVLAVDVSSSVDPNEYELQMGGLARALRDPEVRAAIQATAPEGVAFALLQWAGGRNQHLDAGGWTVLRGDAEVLAFAERIARTPRHFIWGQTGIGEALAAATRELEQNGFEGARRVIDLSGDGKANQFVPPRVARDAAMAGGITINGLAILTSHPDLGDYYHQHVVGGPGAFVIEAAGFPDFAAAMTRKLLRELLPPVAAGPGGGLAVLHTPLGFAIEDGRASAMSTLDRDRRRDRVVARMGRDEPRTSRQAYQYERMTMVTAPADDPAHSPGDARP